MTSDFIAGWRQVVIGFLFLAAAGMIASTYSLIAVPLAEEFKPSRTVLALSMTVMSGVCVILSPILGNLMDRTSLKRLMIGGGLLLAAGYAAISFATTFIQVLIVFGLLIAPANVLIGPVGVTVLLTRWFSKKRGRAMGIAIAGIAFGGFAFSAIIQGLLDTHQWREALRLLSLVLLFWTVPAAFLIIERPSDRGLHPDGAREPPEELKEELSRAPVTVRDVLTDPAFWMIAIAVATVTAGMKGMITNLAPLAIDNGVKASDAASLIQVYTACGFVAKLFFAWLADKLGPRVLMFTSLGGFGLGMATLGFGAASGFNGIMLGVGLIGLFGGMMVPIESYLAPRVFGARVVGRAIGLLAGTILIALLLSPLVFGLIFDLTGSYRGILWTFSGMAFVALLIVPLIRLHPRSVAKAGPAVPALATK
ncbi:MAG: MFS transporter [Novosphingobium sp.]